MYRVYVGKGGRPDTRRVFTVARANDGNLRTHDVEEQGTADQRPDLVQHLNTALRTGLLAPRPLEPLSEWDTASRPWIFYYADLALRAVVGRSLMDTSWQAADMRLVTEHEMRSAEQDCLWQGGAKEVSSWDHERLAWVRNGFLFAQEESLAEVFGATVGLADNVVPMPVLVTSRQVARQPVAVRP